MFGTINVTPMKEAVQNLLWLRLFIVVGILLMVRRFGHVSFARALSQLPIIIADNGGHDSAEVVTQLRAAHASCKNTLFIQQLPNLT